MGDEMKFPNEIWANDTGEYVEYKKDTLGHYIHESRVPISCGGTMEEDELAVAKHLAETRKQNNAVLVKQNADRDEEIYVLKKEVAHLNDLLDRQIDHNITMDGKLHTVLTPGSAEIGHRFVHPYGSGDGSNDSLCECGAEDSSKCVPGSVEIPTKSEFLQGATEEEMEEFQVEGLRAVLEECDAYLESVYKMNSIGTGSILHKKIKFALQRSVARRKV
jgi:hypothetical protein